MPNQLAPETAWRPTASLSNLQLRARLLRHIRDYFAEQQVLEVDTPILSAAGASDVAIDSLMSHVYGPGFADGQSMYLQTSPEYAMKRLLAAGSGPIYQICKVFRDGESGRRHSPEFTLLEWYRPGFDHHRLMDEVEELVSRLLGLDCVAERISYIDLFQCYLDLNPLDVDVATLQACAVQHGITVSDLGHDRDVWLDLLLSHIIEPQLVGAVAGQVRLVFVYDYLPSQAALAQVNSQGLAERFELYLDGVELANGYHELADATEQRHRIDADNERRREMGKSEMPVDEHLLAALKCGLPDCAGVALGLDRLMMCAAGVDDLKQVLTFPLETGL